MQAIQLSLQEGHSLSGTLAYNGINTLKGLIFFGTPFRGSRLANLVTFASKWLLLRHFVNVTTINYLRIKDETVRSVVEGFVNWIMTNKVQVRVFYEQRGVKIGPLNKMVSSPVRHHSKGV